MILCFFTFIIQKSCQKMSRSKAYVRSFILPSPPKSSALLILQNDVFFLPPSLPPSLNPFFHFSFFPPSYCLLSRHYLKPKGHACYFQCEVGYSLWGRVKFIGTFRALQVGPRLSRQSQDGCSSQKFTGF